jgi:DMSO/TMAO reductase YedYZ heme-binding membrane subunit
MNSRQHSLKPSGHVWLPVLIFLVISMVCGLDYWHGAGQVETIRFIIRFTARTSLCLFLLAFTASSAASLFPSRGTRWLLDNRRNFGISFVLSYAVHLAAVAEFYRQAPDLFASVSPTLLIVLRGIGVGFIVFMSLSFFNADMLEERRLRFVAMLGGYYIWGAFLTGFGKRIPESPIYSILVILLIVSLLMRVAAIWKERKRASW